MCGIAGGWVAGGMPKSVLDEAVASLAHRGPDDRGTRIRGPRFLGVRRLSVVDLEGGRQPQENEDGSVSVVLNGEIYNHVELARDLKSAGHRFRSRSDTEALAHLYEERGVSTCERLRGMFAFAVMDERQGRLFLARDRFGKKPLYYARTPDGGLIFASELKALRPLARAAGVPWRIRERSIYDYLSLGAVPQPDTVFESVHALPPGAWLLFDGTSLRIETYWRLRYEPKSRMSRRSAVERVRELVAESVRLRLRSDVPVGVFLSGGIDSSVVAHEAARSLGGGLRTFTVAAGDPEFDESAVAARTAERLGTVHSTLPIALSPADAVHEVVRTYDQPFGDSSAIPSLAIARAARPHVKVALVGDGGDEVFVGYRRYLAARASRWVGLLPRRLGEVLGRRPEAGRRTMRDFVSRVLRGAGRTEADRYLLWTSELLKERDKRGAWKRAPARSTESWIASLMERGGEPLDRFLDLDVRIHLLSDFLVKMDMATMAHSLEARSPLLDHPLAEFVASLPVGFRMRGWRLKSLLRDAYRDRLPAEVIEGRKRGFEVPLVRWVASDLRPLIQDSLGSRNAKVRGWLGDGLIDRLLKGKGDEVPNVPRALYALLILELWLRAESTICHGDTETRR